MAKMFVGVSQRLPRAIAAQAKTGLPVRRLGLLRSGDRLYFWDGKGKRIGLTGIYLGDGTFASYAKNNGVVMNHLGAAKWLKVLVGIRR